MSMLGPDAGVPNPDPAAPPAADPTPPPAAEQPPAATGGDKPTHPEWEATFEALGLPESFRGPLREQARKSEAEAQRAVEAARADSIAPEWREFVKSAQEAEATPADVVQAWNAAGSIARDPMGFAMQLEASIDAMVAQGQMTPTDAWKAKRQAHAAIVAEVQQQQQQQGQPSTPDSDALLTPEQRQLKQVQDEITAMKAAEQARIEAAQQQAQQQTLAQQQAAAEARATTFMSELEQRTKGASPEQMQIIGRTASDMLAADATENGGKGTLTIQAALDAVVDQAKKAGMSWQEQPQPGLAPPPAGGGLGVPTPTPPPLPKGDTPEARDARAARMLEAANLAKVQG